MKNQIWFQTSLGFEATREVLRCSKMLVADWQDWKGRLTFYLKDFKDFTIQITTHSMLSITYPDGADYNLVLEKLKPLLVEADGTQAKKFQAIKELKAAPKGDVSTSKEYSFPHAMAAMERQLEELDFLHELRAKTDEVMQWGDKLFAIELCKVGIEDAKITICEVEKRLPHLKEFQGKLKSAMDKGWIVKCSSEDLLFEDEFRDLLFQADDVRKMVDSGETIEALTQKWLKEQIEEHGRSNLTKKILLCLAQSDREVEWQKLNRIWLSDLFPNL